MPDIYTHQPYIDINKDELLTKANKLRGDGYFLSMLTVNHKEVFELIYTFEKHYEMLNVRIILHSNDEEIESVCEPYPYSYIYENEAKELFGIKIINMAMDFNGHLFKKSVDSPFLSCPTDSGKERK